MLVSPNKSTLLGSPINVLNDLTINSGNTLVATYAGVLGNITIVGGNWTNNGTFMISSSSVSFVGSANTNIAGSSAVIITTAACNAPSVVRTSGSVVGNLSMAYPPAASTTTFTYHIGDGTSYSPATIFP